MRNLAAASLTTTGGSAFTNISRPLVSTVLAIWAFAPGANELAHKANAAKQMLAVIAVLLPMRFVIWPQGRLCNGDATFLHRYDSRVRGSPTVPENVSETAARLTRLANYEAVSFEGDNEA